jgi:hypothetical protein
MCYWNASEETCLFIEPANEIKVTIFVAIFSALVATPIAVLCDWLILNILAAPTAIESVGVVSFKAAEVSLASIIPACQDEKPIASKTAARTRLRSSRNQSLTELLPFGATRKSQYRAQAESDMNMLVESIISYRKKLTIYQKRDFDGKFFFRMNI